MELFSQILHELDEIEAGIVLAALLDRQNVEGKLQRFQQPVGTKLLEAYKKLRTLDHSHRHLSIMDLSRRLFAPIPENIERVHPSWIKPLLGAEPSPIFDILVQALPETMLARLNLPSANQVYSSISPRVRVQICRHVFSGIASMPEALDAHRNRDIAEPATILAWTGARVEATLTHMGCIALASMVVRANSTLRNHILALLHPPWDFKLKQAIEAYLPRLPHSIQLPNISGMSLETILTHLGAQALSPALSSFARHQAAQLIPKPLGEFLLSPPKKNTDSKAVLRLIKTADLWYRGSKL